MCVQHELFTKRTLRELRFLRLLRHENILPFRAASVCGDLHSFSDVYLICRLSDTDLASIIKSRQHLTEVCAAAKLTTHDTHTWAGALLSFTHLCVLLV